MNQFRSFDQLRTNELSVLRHGFFRPWYELTDGQFCYGKLTYTALLKRVCVIETDQGAWTIKRKGFMSRILLIEQPEKETIGSITPELWSRKIALSMNNGFEAIFLNKKILSRTHTWISDQYGDIVNIESKLWSWGKPFKVNIDLNLLKSVPTLPLLALLGIHLILLKQAKAAAAAG
jgi:hypothetical protein